jgi:hypothetical protein
MKALEISSLFCNLLSQDINYNISQIVNIKTRQAMYMYHDIGYICVMAVAMKMQQQCVLSVLLYYMSLSTI